MERLAWNGEGGGVKKEIAPCASTSSVCLDPQRTEAGGDMPKPEMGREKPQQELKIG
jgi:hypothetical protein